MENGVKLIACTMSMDIMGLTKDELIDGIDYAGVGAYLGDAEESNVNLFIYKKRHLKKTLCCNRHKVFFSVT